MKFRPPFPHALPDPKSLGYPVAVETYAMRLRSFYNSRATWHRRFFRLSGITVIVVGASLPLLATLDFPGTKLAVSVAGVVVAGVTALRAFYRWDQSWILLRNTERAITEAWWDWHGDLDNTANGDSAPDPRQIEVTREFARKLIDIRKREADSFFADLAFPAHNVHDRNGNARDQARVPGTNPEKK
ncbi:DUF4231 domain-containing protein [Amycolatopsis australiensis]|uniref:DUF4231 domain-containing protein n=1 Tax=Amycolatopsis australiensis TaxID=546364 RepID=A0A1K1PHA8_9PSEU|nr:DUF4231 domain-containing protein [Amycolatopsis australiensis]SFW46972.1 Protein of unknown function [Amycolatopsis australiensis]